MSGFPFNKVAGLQTCNFFEETPTQVFPADIAKFLKTALFIEQLRWLLLKVRTFDFNQMLSQNVATVILYPHVTILFLPCLD